MCLIEVGFCSPWASSSDSLLLEEAAEAESEATAAAIPADAAARGGLALPLLLGELFNDARRLAAAASISPFLVSSDESELRFAGSFLSIDAEVHVESSSSLSRDLFWLLLLVLLLAKRQRQQPVQLISLPPMRLLILLPPLLLQLLNVPQWRWSVLLLVRQ